VVVAVAEPPVPSRVLNTVLLVDHRFHYTNTTHVLHAMNRTNWPASGRDRGQFYTPLKRGVYMHTHSAVTAARRSATQENRRTRNVRGTTRLCTCFCCCSPVTACVRTVCVPTGNNGLPAKPCSRDGGSAVWLAS
jgi:hypothetical protein